MTNGTARSPVRAEAPVTGSVVTALLPVKRPLMHLAFYAGWPNAMTAVSVAKEVFQNKQRETEGDRKDPQ